MTIKQMEPTTTEVKRTERKFVEQTPYGPFEVTEITILRQQVWPLDAGIYAGKSYELGTVYHNGIIVHDWSTPWKA